MDSGLTSDGVTFPFRSKSHCLAIEGYCAVKLSLDCLLYTSFSEYDTGKNPLQVLLYIVPVLVVYVVATALGFEP